MIGDPTRPLVVMALPQEGGALFESVQVPVLYTGVGKINAAYHLTLRLAEYRARNLPLPLVVNFGTAGSAQPDLFAAEFFDRLLDRLLDRRLVRLMLPAGKQTAVIFDVEAKTRHARA